MKKFLSLVLALAMVACMSVTAFAADGTTVLTAEVPDNTTTYTLHIPANVTLEYGNTDKQTIGELYITDVENFTGRFIGVSVPYTDLINTEDSSDTLSITLFAGDTMMRRYINPNDPSDITSVDAPVVYYPGYDNDQYDSDGYRDPTIMKVQVSDWSGATPGDTYQATITYIVRIVK